MKLLPADFQITRYGVTARLVTEADAEFITQLRSDKRLGRYIHSSDGNVEKQIQWTREYKKREAEGLDYYFIFSKEGIDYGLCRIYNIDWIHLSFTSGSWLTKKGTLMEDAMYISLILDEISYDILGLIINLYDVRKGNKQVLMFHRKIRCSIEYAETDEDVLFLSTPDSRRKSKLKKYLTL